MILGEARLAARIRHPNVVPPLDVLAENGELLLVMEYVHGEPLSRLLRLARAHGDPVPIPVASAIISSILHGLHSAHEARSETGEPLGLVHRDVSPQNIIVGADGAARIIDFGIAKAITSTDETMVGTIKGKVPYLAPEQIQGGAVTRRIDIYAASVVMWEMLAGRRLFDGQDDADLLRRIVSIRVQPPTGEPALDAIVLAGLAPRPDDRFATARDMALALESAAPPAMPSQVAAWVDRLAGEALEERAAILHRIESGAPPVEFNSETLVMKPAAAATARLPGPGARGPAGQEPYTPSHPQFVPPAHAQPQPPAAAAPARKSGAPIWPIFPLLLVLALAGAWFAAPFFIERKAKAWAEERGIVLVIDKVQLGRKAIRFVGVHATAREVPEVKAQATTIILGLRGFTPETITIEGADIRAQGTVKEVAFGVGAWQKMHAQVISDGLASYKHLSVANGKVGWSGYAGPKTEATLEGVDLEVENVGTRSFGEDFHAVAAKVSLDTGGVGLGPWQLQADREGPIVRGNLRFDASVENTASLGFAVGGDAPTMSFRIPPTKLANLHLPSPEIATPESKLSAIGDLTLGTAAHGTIHLGMTLLKSNDATYDLALDVPITAAQAIDAPVTITNGGRIVGQTKLSGDATGGRLSLFGHTECVGRTMSFDPSLVVTLLPPSDTRLGLESARCPGK